MSHQFKCKFQLCSLLFLSYVKIYELVVAKTASEWVINSRIFPLAVDFLENSCQLTSPLVEQFLQSHDLT